MGYDTSQYDAFEFMPKVRWKHTTLYTWGFLPENCCAHTVAVLGSALVHALHVSALSRLSVVVQSPAQLAAEKLRADAIKDWNAHYLTPKMT